MLTIYWQLSARHMLLSHWNIRTALCKAAGFILFILEGVGENGEAQWAHIPCKGKWGIKQHPLDLKAHVHKHWALLVFTNIEFMIFWQM